uniref:Ig-like domain-containing protein n=1 Tax=Astyanax mexicanus TaxID=7994 RepID=A0A3B1JKH1_ASTMX
MPVVTCYPIPSLSAPCVLSHAVYIEPLYLSVLWLLLFKTVAVFTGTEGGSVEINCRYKDSYIYSKQYFCRDPCRYFDVLIETSKADIPVSKDRYSILNTVSARSVSVTIKNLSLTDSGVYYCGVDQWGSDILTEVEISVKKGEHTFNLLILHDHVDSRNTSLISLLHCTHRSFSLPHVHTSPSIH